MKIEIHISTHQLSVMNELICNTLINSDFVQTPEVRCTISIMQDISKKLLKKAIDKFGTSKKFKLSFKYYEAYALHQFIHLFIDLAPLCDMSELRHVLGLLNQKLV